MIEYFAESDALGEAVLSCSEGWLIKVAGVSDLTSTGKGLPLLWFLGVPACPAPPQDCWTKWMTQYWGFANQEQRVRHASLHMRGGGDASPRASGGNGELKPDFMVLK